MNFSSLDIHSPKRSRCTQHGWDRFFPYYAGYPEDFVRALLKSTSLPEKSTIFDPWNGSGTTTFSACQLGYVSLGFDINPAMIVIARARLLQGSESDSLEPLSRELVKGIRSDPRSLKSEDALFLWFEPTTASFIRALERRIREQLLGERTLTSEGVSLEYMSGFAAAFYVALFTVCRQLVAPFRSSNPTWLRKPKFGEPLIAASRSAILTSFLGNISNMAATLSERTRINVAENVASELYVRDTTSAILPNANVDMVLTSPPYCTRIDYSCATRIELAVLSSFVGIDVKDLGRKMIGSTRVPDRSIDINPAWGDKCCRFLVELRQHASKSSSGYYYKTHLDYFDKINRSIANITSAIKPGGTAVFIVQDSYYKDIYNDLPGAITEIAESSGLTLRRRENFEFKRSMSGINPYTQKYKRNIGAIESVLCFEKTFRGNHANG